ncbi:MAG: zinc dependent phospholipase C family protein [Defluviitaleaceae bacterium]|nr:zinc dependent phospholipase C family protein [Defluviitaleaceae bacterium]
MPGFLTHYIAGKTALQATLHSTPQLHQAIAPYEQLYNLGTLGPDVFFYYFPSQILKRSRGLAQEMHQGGMGLLIEQLACTARQAEGQERDIIFAYMGGFLMHYVLDCHIHPYIYARSFKRGNVKIVNSLKHRRFESALDDALLGLICDEKPAGVKQWQLINAEGHSIAVSAEALRRGLAGVYKRKVSVQTIQRALKFTIHATKVICSKNIDKLTETIILREPTAVGDCDCLNMKKTPWRTPWPSEMCNDSFMERYSLALDEGISILESLYAFVYNGEVQPFVIANKLGNRSLKTGQQCA